MKSMTSQDIALLRLVHQEIAAPRFTDPGALVAWMGCLQAQDYAMAKWAVGCRLAGNVTEAGIEQALQEGTILRTHVLRPTWHFVAPKDIRWMLALTGTRIKAFAKGHHRQLGIEPALLKRSKKIIEQSLSVQGGLTLTRKALQEALAGAKISTDAARMGFILLDAELDGLIVSAGKKGAQLAYGLLDAMVPAVPPLKREEALAELAKRYFISHGPATVADFAWWAGLLLADAKKGLAMNAGGLQSMVVNGQEYWWSGEGKRTVGQPVYLLPAFDEFFISYKDRTDLVHKDLIKSVMTTNGIFRPIVVVNGRIAGLWSKEVKGGRGIKVHAFEDTVKIPEKGFIAVTKKYEDFIRNT